MDSVSIVLMMENFELTGLRHGELSIDDVVAVCLLVEMVRRLGLVVSVCGLVGVAGHLDGF